MSDRLPSDIADVLLRTAEEYVVHSYAPYSADKRACVLLLEDGSLIPGVRVENASFPLSLPAILNAFGTAAAMGRHDVTAIALSWNASDADIALLANHPDGQFVFTSERVALPQTGGSLPAPTAILDPVVSPAEPLNTTQSVALAHEIADNAVIPESDFPVGAILELSNGNLIPGVNVEHPDWLQIICAERNAIGTAITYNHRDISNIYVSCPTDDQASPCGACRQVMVELAPNATVWMDRGNQEAESARVDKLLPGYFSGQALHRID